MDPTITRDQWQRISAILDAVLELPVSDRAAYLDTACNGDPSLRHVLDELLAASDASATFLSTPAGEKFAPLVAAIDEALAPSIHGLEGRVVGAYRIVRRLGEGGMGVVCLAERVDGHFEQRVAIKLVKHGLYSEEGRRRFLQERRILAHLEHPAIARLLDGGVTEEGTPFFVMECVNGRPVTSYCADAALTIDQRLDVFLQICDAVQYAHRNLIVHRDLKPSNILVDESGRVKLLDFGIAKLLAEDDSVASPPTIGRALTPEYAAPEQLLGEPASTTADVYALGVLLYELLAGVGPYRVQGTAPGEIERAILEQEPVPPGSRVATKDLRRRLRGDLDRIVLKALQKAPDRRYPSAEAIATDVRRHLRGLPVSAQGDALFYRLGKFFRRHRLAASAAALLLLTLVAGLAATTWQSRRAQREAQKADAVKEFLKTLFAAANPEQTAGREPSVRQLLDAGAARIESELRNQPDVQSEVTQVIGAAYHSLGEYDRAAELYRAELARRKAIDGPRSAAVATALTGIADALYEQGRNEEAGAMYGEALSIVREKLGDRSVEVAELLWDLGGVARTRGDLARAEALEKASLAVYAEKRGGDSEEAIGVRESLAITYAQGGRFADAASIQAQVASARERHLTADHPNALNSRYNLAYAYVNLGRAEDAIRISEDVVARQRRVLGPNHDRLALTLRLLARARDQAGRAEDAVAPAAEALAIQTREFGRDHAQIATDLVWQAVIEAHTGKLVPAERDAREALAFFDRHDGASRADWPYPRTLAGLVLADAGRLEDADREISEAASDLRAAHHDNAFLAFALDAAGDVALRRAQPARARSLTTEGLALMERTLDPEHPAIAFARLHAGAALWASGSAADGERLIRNALAPLERRFPGGHPDLATAWLSFGDLLRRDGRGREAHVLIQRALAWREAHFGASDPRTADARRLATLTRS
jgi:serine/threonine-protein kinase